MLMYILALGSPTHPVEPEAWEAWTAGYRWGSFQGQEQLGFAPLFGHQYTQVWFDLRGIQRRVHAANTISTTSRTPAARCWPSAPTPWTIPGGWRGYGPRLWGLTACDGPVHGTFDHRRDASAPSRPTGRAARRSPGCARRRHRLPLGRGGVAALRAGDRRCRS